MFDSGGVSEDDCHKNSGNFENDCQKSFKRSKVG